MRFPNGGPHLEFHFYWASLTEQEAFLRLVAALCDLGAEFRKCDVSTIEELERCMVNPTLDVNWVSMEGATDTTPGIAEIITFTTISDRALGHDHRPIAIRTEGQWTEAFQRQSKTGYQRARSLGRRAKNRFCTLVEMTWPSYAAITVERSLRTPYELCQRPENNDFHDFYLSGLYVGAEALSTVTNAYAGAFIERLAEGVYISCWEFLNPRSRNLITGVEAAQTTTGRCIGAAR